MIIKNSNIRKMLVEKRYGILAGVIAIILFFMVLSFLNNFSKEQLKQQEEQIQNTQTSQAIYQPEETIISGSNVSQQQQVQNEDIIQEFMQFCMQGNIQQAYNLLSEDCQAEVFSSNIANFQNGYIASKFATPKTYNIQSWINAKQGTTYQVHILEDILATGNSNVGVIEDYFTIVNTSNGLRLNINGYIGKEELNAVASRDGLTITIVGKQIYKDYETYEFEVQNTTDYTMLLDTKQNTNSVYLRGENGTKYYSYVYEVDNVALKILPRTTKKVEIRFQKLYSNRTQMDGIAFGEIINNLEEYEKLQDTTNTTYKMDLGISF